MFLMILGAMFVGDVLWWWRADARLRRIGARWWWRGILGTFVGFQLLYLLWFVFIPVQARHSYGWMPTPLLAGVYLWHLLVLPVSGVVMIFGAVGRRLARFLNPARSGEAVGLLNRRAFVGAAVAALPPIVTAGAVIGAMRQLHHLRIRAMTLALPQLPKSLDGITIAHVTDIHIGRFTRAPMLPKIVDTINSLRADLVLFTGDLIDLSLSDLPSGIDFIRKLDPRSGIVLCEGNHDLIEDRFGFEFRARQAGLPLLLDEAMTVAIRGEYVQLLGLKWNRGARGIDESMQQLLPKRDPGAFQILLAHHPHAFDPAAAAGIPLTLAGHTHGGQLMLNERLGVGPVMFRYWSGLYRKENAALVVSNGAGNWFPLRTAAPAEIIHLTLRRSEL